MIYDLVIWWSRWIWKAIVSWLHQEWQFCIYTWTKEHNSDYHWNIYQRVNLLDRTECMKIISQIYKEYIIRNLFISAWISIWKWIQWFTVDDIYDSLTVNLILPALISKLHIEHCINNWTQSSIVFLWSTTWIKWWKIWYATSKAWIIGLTKSIANEVWRYWIRANCIIPGPVNTDLIKDRSPEKAWTIKNQLNQWRFAEAYEIANIALFLWSEKSSYLNWSIIDASWGQI